MDRPRRAIAVWAIAVFVCFAPAIARAESESAVEKDLAKMPWSAGSHGLEHSHGSFTVPKGDEMVQDADAAHADDLLNGSTNSDTEGLVRVPQEHALLYLEYVDSGYVTLDDWKDLDAPKMLADMKQNDEDANPDRVKNGAQAIHIDGWIRQPTLDHTNNSVEYVVKLHDDKGTTFLNAVALALGRHGYERFTLAADAEQPDASSKLLHSLVADYRFSKGFRFADYVQGDKLAGFGVAALVGSVAGVAIAKTIGWGALLLLAKKFIIVIFAAVAGFFGWLRKKLARPKTTFGPPQA